MPYNTAIKFIWIFYLPEYRLLPAPIPLFTELIDKELNMNTNYQYLRIHNSNNLSYQYLIYSNSVISTKLGQQNIIREYYHYILNYIYYMLANVLKFIGKDTGPNSLVRIHSSGPNSLGPNCDWVEFTCFRSPESLYPD